MELQMSDLTVPAIGAFSALIALVLLLWLVRWIGRRNRSVPDDPALWTGRDYPCPQCGQSMAEGWVLLGKGAIWSDRANGRPGTFALITSALPNTLSLRLTPAANMAWRCARCQLLLLDHSRLVR